jgi:photosystem II stability/assembly factor-like uncharacterized protein
MRDFSLEIWRSAGSAEADIVESLLFLATADGLVVLQRDGDTWRETDRGLDGQNVTSVIAREGVILAGTTDGVFRSDDLGHTWQAASAGLTHRHVRWMAFRPEISDFELVGTEPAAIFISRDGAETWRECPEVGQLRDQRRWSMPYSPEAGCVRGFAFHGQRAYAAVEVGGALRSDDGGLTWRMASEVGYREPLVNPDVHSIATHPSSPDLVFAPTAGGFYRSADGGASWARRYVCYCRAAWIDPDDPDHIIFGPADSVDRNGRIEETHDGGRTWAVASSGLAVPWRRYMVERFVQVGEELLAILSKGELLAASLATLEWRRILPENAGVAAATAMA